MRKVQVIFGTVALLILQACSAHKSEEQEAAAIQLPVNGIARGAYLTKNQHGEAVLCWTELDTADSLNCLKYAVYDSIKNVFGQAITVYSSRGCGASAESMAKVAFKADGAIIAVFAKPFPKEKNRFAGAIYYSMSADQGKSWLPAAFLHSDTSHAYGRNFFDITTLNDGEVAAIWLDGRFGKTIKGSALYFSRTQKQGGFGREACLLKGTCECCRTELLQDSQGTVHLALRDIMEVGQLQDNAKQVRDMIYMRSTSGGNGFAAPEVVSSDNWEVSGCPHSGPSLAVAGNRVHAVWFTAGGAPGVYYTSRERNSGKFRPRTLVSSKGRHPQMVALPNGVQAIVCEETEAAVEHHTHGHQAEQTEGSSIVLRYLSHGQIQAKSLITNGQFADSHAVLLPLSGRILLAWERKEPSGTKIYYQLTNSKIY
ncbi:sialidase family protein [Pedobacter faecalis]|uniref:sialidase family protein n=1 Tax=Pedobacter faecalis TaxID=3041495 RepID=UPI00254B0AD3|nr:sialidase family protein [Pedobacter sp. ELA7]